MSSDEVEIRFRGSVYGCRKGETLLESFRRQGVELPYTCRKGICLTCMLRATDGEIPAKTQAGLKETLRAQNYFLSCICKPQEPLEVALPEDCGFYRRVTVLSVEHLTPKIARLLLEPEAPLDYFAGQFVTLRRSDGLSRPYSLASHPSLDRHLELHVQRMPDGLMSGWVHDSLAPGMTAQVSESSGSCFYLPAWRSRNLLMIGTGSGLSPLLGVARDALAQGHDGEIRLYHGSRDPAGLYLQEDLRSLAERHHGFSYVPCMSGPDTPVGCRPGRADENALADHPDLTGWRVLLGGNPAMVRSVRKRAYLAGASLADINAEAFEVRDPSL